MCCTTVQCNSLNNFQNNDWKVFYKAFTKCDTLEVDSSKELEITYFHVNISNSSIELKNIISSSNYLMKRITSSLECMESNIISPGEYHIIYVQILAEKDYDEGKNIDKLVSNFKKMHSIDIETKTYRLGYFKTVN